MIDIEIIIDFQLYVSKNTIQKSDQHVPDKDMNALIVNQITVDYTNLILNKGCKNLFNDKMDSNL